MADRPSARPWPSGFMQAVRIKPAEGPRPTIAVLFDNLSSEYAVHLRRSVERAAARRGVRILVVTGQPIGAPEAVLVTQNQIYEVVSKSRVDGVIVVSA